VIVLTDGEWNAAVSHHAILQHYEASPHSAWVGITWWREYITIAV
jgi:hypothetical protein